MLFVTLERVGVFVRGCVRGALGGWVVLFDSTGRLALGSMRSELPPLP